jgi:hypothetical protein
VEGWVTPAFFFSERDGHGSTIRATGMLSGQETAEVFVDVTPRPDVVDHDAPPVLVDSDQVGGLRGIPGTPGLHLPPSPRPKTDLSFTHRPARACRRERRDDRIARRVSSFSPRSRIRRRNWFFARLTGTK